ncbi:MAG: hypothetical protein ACE5IM_14220, partial [Nitrospinota bacterium]
DIFAPCALGAVINSDTLPRLRCKIVAGAANNVLLEDSHGRALEEAGVSTVSVSVVRDLSEMMTLPRVVSPRFPIGNPLGRAGDRQGQRRVLWEALRTLEERTRPGEIVDLPYPFDDPPAA